MSRAGRVIPWALALIAMAASELTHGLGGEILAESRPGEGSTSTVRLPAAAPG